MVKLISELLVKPNKLIIKKSKDKILVTKTENFRPTKFIEQVLEKPISSGYFTIGALTTQNTDNHDLLTFLVHSQSHEIREEKKVDYNVINRKIIQNNVLSRREKKKERRLNMPLMLKYSKESSQNDHNIQGTGESFENAPELIREILVRTDYMLNTEELGKFIQDNVEDVAETAFKKINYAAESFEEIQLEINTLWSDLRNKLTNITSEAQLSLNALRDEVLTYAKTIKINSADLSNLGENPRDKREITLSLFLATLTFVEFCLYLFVICILRQKTKNFTKID